MSNRCEDDVASSDDPVELISSESISVDAKAAVSDEIVSSDSEDGDDSVALRSAYGFEPASATSPSPLQVYAVAGESPGNDLESLQGLLPRLCEAKGVSRVERIKHVLVLGATGRLGRMAVHQLARYERLTINCLVRANKVEVAATRLRDALESICSVPEASEIMSRVRVWAGDVTLSSFGMSEVDYTKLVQRVEGVYVLIGPDINSQVRQATGEIGSLYSSMAPNSIQFWRHVLDFAVTYRHKHIWTATPIYYSAQLLSPSSQTTTRVSETISCASPGDVSPHQTFVGFQAWRKIVVEQLCAIARSERKMSITIFRLPPTSFYASNNSQQLLTETLQSKCLPFFWHLMRLIVRTGTIPDLPHHFFTLFFHPIDQAVQNLVTLSLCRKRLHSTYNVIEDQISSKLTRESLLDILGELGIFVKIVPASVFANEAANLPDLDPISNTLCQDVLDLGRQFGNASERTCLSCISTVNYEQDRQVNIECFDESRNSSFLREGLCNLLCLDFFPSDSLGTLRYFSDCRERALVISGGLADFGEWLEVAESGWTRLLAELHDDERSVAKFAAKAICARNLIVYLTNLLFMTERESECPEILEMAITAPIFIVGLNRAGTALLHHLLSQDHTRNRCPTQMELSFPYAPNGFYQPVALQGNDRSAWQEDPRKEPATFLSKLNGDGDTSCSISAAEDCTPSEILGRSFALTTKFGLPQLRDWLLASDAQEMRKCYPLHKRLLQHLEFQRPGKRWILRWPWHLFTVDSLLATYPDAEIIFIHRRPFGAVQSYCMYEHALQQKYLKKVESDVIGRSSLSALSQAVKNAVRVQEEMALAFVQQHPALQPPQSFFLNIYLDEFVANPIGTVSGIYSALELPPLTVSAEKAMWNCLQETTRLQEVIAAKATASFGQIAREEFKLHFATYMQLYFHPDQRRKRKQEYRVAKAIRTNAVEPKALYDERGTIIMDGKSWVDRVGLSSPVNNMEVLLSYARTRFATAHSTDE